MNLTSFLKTNGNSRRIFGEKELEIIRKQIKGIKLTQSERNRLSRDIKPKLEFIRQLAKFEDEFILTKNQENKEIIKKAVSKILEDELNKNIMAILLFGSFADGSFTTRSDIDICVVFKDAISLREATKFRIRISGQLPDKVDIQVFNILPLKIKKTIAANHKILYRNGFDNVSFSIRHMKDNSYFFRMKKVGLLKNE